MHKCVLLLSIIFVTTVSQAQPIDWQPVEKALGRKGTVQGDALKVTFPRSDLRVHIGEVAIEPALALTSWIAFKKTGEHTMMMGDLVLLDSEIASVITTLIAHGLDVSAIHNHIVGESPSIKYLHFGGHGDAATLAEAMMSVLSVTKTPLTPPQSAQAPTSYDWSKVESILGRPGVRKGNVLQFGIPRSETITENSIEIPPFMGMATGLNLQLVGEKAVATGDFVLLASEVNPVVRVLTEHSISVTAIHSHMLFESPRLFFLHFWGFDMPQKLARGLYAALGMTNSETKR